MADFIQSCMINIFLFCMLLLLEGLTLPLLHYSMGQSVSFLGCLLCLAFMGACRKFGQCFFAYWSLGRMIAARLHLYHVVGSVSVLRACVVGCAKLCCMLCRGTVVLGRAMDGSVYASVFIFWPLL